MSGVAGPAGVLLVNVGTPDAPRSREVRRFLREFLSDPRVLDTNAVARFLLLRLVILPFRPRRSAEAYRKIWTPQGSPLLVHGRALRDALETRLGSGFAVALAMRYGRPSIAEALGELREKGCGRIVVFPLYPQFASSTTGSTLEKAYRLAAPLWNVPSISVVPAFYSDPGFIAALAETGRAALAATAPDHVLFSFHGLPERQVLRSDRSGHHCLRSPGCCDRIVAANRDCYRAQCFETARLLSDALSLAPHAWSVAFQSRLGRVPWIGPATDREIAERARTGARRMAVFCPAFVADCLETLEEIGIRGAESFRDAGGETLHLVHSLNGSAAWADAAARLVRRAAGEPAAR
jgi:ferrochelatase